MVIFSHSHQDPGSTILNALQPLDALGGDPDEKRVAVVQPGGDEGVDEFFGVWQGEGGAEL